MPVTSSSVPPRGRRTRSCPCDSGNTTHSLPRAFTSDPTAKLILASQRLLDTGRSCLTNLLDSQSGSQNSRDPPGTPPPPHHVLAFRDNRDKGHQYKSQQSNPDR